MNTPNVKYNLLTIREKEVFNLIIENHTTDSIAKQLDVTFETARSHRKKIYKKLRVHSLVDLLNFYHTILTQP
ncbi:MAG: helix-turn-helix transcriptional regulator [Arcicella sp.]|nr:helix-turn-helix transcriptional regulator [Arcicella sp.]